MNALICLSHLTKKLCFSVHKKCLCANFNSQTHYFLDVFIIRLPHTYISIHVHTLTDSNKLLAVGVASISLFNALNCAVIIVITPLLLSWSRRTNPCSPLSLSPHLSAHFSLPLSLLSSCTAGHWLHQSQPVMSFSIKHTVAKQLPISRHTRLCAPATHQHSRPIRWVGPLSRSTVIRKYKGSGHNLENISSLILFLLISSRNTEREVSLGTPELGVTFYFSGYFSG